MPSTKVKPLKKKPAPIKSKKRVKVRKKPTASDNVITKPKPRPRPVKSPTTRKIEKGRVKKRKLQKQESLDTSIVDAKAKQFSAEVAEGDHRTFKGYATTGLGDILDVTGVTASRWVASGLLPKPIFQAGRAHVYHVEEARAIYRVMVPHLEAHKAYRPDQVETRKRLFDDIAAVREGLFTTK